MMTRSPELDDLRAAYVHAFAASDIDLETEIERIDDDLARGRSESIAT